MALSAVSPIIMVLLVFVVIHFLIYLFKPEPRSLYVKRNFLFTAAERSFYGVLQLAVENQAFVFGKVRVADVLAPQKGLSPKDWQKAFNRISAKHFDFVLCSRDTLSILCVIELDDRSHNTPARNSRDRFLQEICTGADLPLIHFPAKHVYSVHEIRAALTPYLPGIQSSNADEESPRTQADIKTQQSDSQKVCPKCSSPLVKRTVKNGSNKGSTFWGCSNYPNCRYTENIN